MDTSNGAPRQAADDASIEQRLNAAELELKHAQLEEARCRRCWGSASPTVVAIMAALIGFLGSTCAAYYQHRTAIELERERFQSTLVLEYIKTSDVTVARRNVAFLLQTQLLADRGGLIRQYLESRPAEAPWLPSGSGGNPVPPSGSGGNPVPASGSGGNPTSSAQ